MLNEALINYLAWKDSDGSFCKEWFDEDGYLHRECGTASIRLRADGSIQWERFYLNGVYHRDRGPAYIEYHSDGSIREHFCLHGEYLGEDCEGFWALWGDLTYEQRQNHDILKYLTRYL
jgi:hypothetical protein